MMLTSVKVAAAVKIMWRRLHIARIGYASMRPVASYASMPSTKVKAIAVWGLQHIYAQTLYRLGETNQADAAYNQMLTTANDEDVDDDNPAVNMDADEREDVLANALANRAANYTPGSSLSAAAEDGGNSNPAKSWLEEDETLQHLLSSYGTGGNNNDDEDMLQNYDLAYTPGIIRRTLHIDDHVRQVIGKCRIVSVNHFGILFS